MTNLWTRLWTGATWTPQRVRTVALAVLLPLDALFIGLHVLRALLNDTPYEGFWVDDRWSLELDRSFPERFQYLLAGLTAGVLLALYTSRPTLTYLGWTVAFVFILVDDAFSLHEQFTTVFVNGAGAGAVLGVQARVYAASVLWGAVGLLLLVLLALGYYRDVASRAFSRQLTYSLSALFFCGAVLDALHLLAGSADLGRPIAFSLGTLEDGGELVIVSVALALSLTHWARQRLSGPL